MIDHEALRRAAAILAVADRLERLLEREAFEPGEALILDNCVLRLRARIEKALPGEGRALGNDAMEVPRHGEQSDALRPSYNSPLPDDQ